MPAFVRGLLADQLGASVVAVHPAEGGFSPSFAGSADLDDGRRVFIKAVSDEQNPDTPGMVRREVEATEALAGAVAAPRLLATVDERGWVAGAFEHAAGDVPPLPWRPAELDRALAALGRLNAAAAPDCLPRAAEVLGPIFEGWRILRDRGGVLDAWANSRIEQLVELERAAVEAVSGDRLVHNDVRADNMMIEGRRHVTFVDWAHACAGPPWLDLVLWLPALQLEGGGAPDAVLAQASELSVPDGDLTAVHAASTGYFLHRSTLPDPPGLPTVRAFQRQQGEVALQWLKERLS